MSKQDLSDKRACQLMPSADFLGQADFIDKDNNYCEWQLTITAVTREELQLPGRRSKEPKIVVAFKGAKKRLVLNKTNLTAIASHYGDEVKNWLGKKVTVLWTETELVSGRRINNPSGGPDGGVRVKGKQ